MLLNFSGCCGSLARSCQDRGSSLLGILRPDVSGHQGGDAALAARIDAPHLQALEALRVQCAMAMSKNQPQFAILHQSLKGRLAVHTAGASFSGTWDVNHYGTLRKN